MLRKWTKIFRRTKQDITKGRRTYWPTYNRPTNPPAPWQTRNFGPRIEQDAHLEKHMSRQSETVKKSRLLNAICDHPSLCLPSVFVFKSSFIVASGLGEQGAVTTSRGKTQGTRHDTLHDLGLIAFCLKMNSVPTHITLVTDHLERESPGRLSNMNHWNVIAS